MKLSHALLTTAFSLSLAACGGGGGEGAPPPAAAAQPTVSLAEFQGVWKRDPAHVACKPNFIYNSAYHYRLRDLTLTDLGSGQLELAMAVVAYDDNTCSMERGVVTERFKMTALPITRSGRDNVFKADPVFVEGSAGGTGGLSITVTALPDGRMSELNGARLIADVSQGQLVIATQFLDVTVDGGGYPNDFEADNYWIH